MPATLPFRPLKIPIRSRNCKRDDTSLPKRLDDIVPTCAEPCVNSYISQYWVPGRCSNSTDFGCLCSRYSQSGYTVGEIALACVSSSCPQAQPAQVSQIYNVCGGQSGAVTATHTILTVLVSPTPSSTTSSISSTPTSRSTFSSLTVSSTSSTSSLSTLTSSLSSTQILPIITAVPGPPSSSASGSAQPGSQLTSGQAVGVTVGAFGGIGLAIALVFCCIAVRKRKAKQKETVHKKKHSYDFSCAETPRFSPFQTRHGDIRGPLGGSHQQRAELSEQPDRRSNRMTQWLVPGGAAKTRHSRSMSPASIKSDRTVSQLLPDKPPSDAQMASHAALDKNSKRPFSAQTQGTVFEEDRTPWSPGLQKPAPIQLNFNFAPDRHTRDTPGSIPPFPVVPRRRSNQSLKSMNLSLTIPKKTPLERSIAEDLDTSKEVNTGDQMTGVPYQTPKSANPNQTLSAGSTSSYLPAYYTSTDSRTPIIPLKSPSRPYIPQHAFRSPPPQKPLPKAPLPHRRPSRASETSFESVDPNEITPEEELDRRINPENASPISGLRYPKIPRSANQAIPRSPPISPQRWASPHDAHPLTRSGTLASKRRGVEAANDMQRRLGLAEPFQAKVPHSAQKKNRDSFLSYETPARKPVNRPTNPNAFITPPRTSSQAHRVERPKLSVFPNTTPTPPRGRDMMRTASPARGPRLTPTKRGDDLFLAVNSP